MRNERQQAADKSRGTGQKLSPELSEFLHMLDALESQTRDPSSSNSR